MQNLKLNGMKNSWLIILLVLTVAGCDYTSDSIDPNLTGKSGSITRFAIYGDYMYALDQNVVLVYNISNSGDPILANKVETDYGLETIIIYDETIYLGSRTSLYILDITAPEAPIILSKTDRADVFIGGCDPVVVKDQYAYATIKNIVNVCGNIAEQSLLITYDVSDKNNPVEVNSFPMDLPNGLGYEGNYLFVTDEGTDKLIIFDITAGDTPAFFNSVDLTDPVDLITDGDKMIVSTLTDFVIYDISDVNNVTKLSTIPKT